MIVGFEDKITQRIFLGAHTRRFSADVETAALRKLQMLNAATCIEDLQRMPGLKCKRMSGKLQGFWSIRVNDQYRILFVWKGKPPDADRVWLTDPH